MACKYRLSQVLLCRLCQATTLTIKTTKDMGPGSRQLFMFEGLPIYLCAITCGSTLLHLTTSVQIRTISSDCNHKTVYTSITITSYDIRSYYLKLFVIFVDQFCFSSLARICKTSWRMQILLFSLALVIWRRLCVCQPSWPQPV